MANGLGDGGRIYTGAMLQGVPRDLMLVFLNQMSNAGVKSSL